MSTGAAAQLPNPKSFFAVADQGVVSLGNFATNLILGRALSPGDFGVWALLFGVMLLLNTVQAALINSPLSIKAAAEQRQAVSRLATLAISSTVLLALVASPVIFVVAWYLKQSSLAWPILAASLAWQLQETMRRALLAHFRYAAAITGDVIAYLGQVAAVFALVRIHRLSLLAVLAVFIVSSLLAACLQGASLRLRTFGGVEFANFVGSAWELGRWIFFGNLVTACSVQAFFWTLVLAKGTAEAGALQALVTILGVSHPILFGAANLIVPMTASARERLDWKGAIQTGVNYGKRLGVPAFGYYAVLLLFPGLVLRTFYGADSPYRALTLALRLFAVVYGLNYIAAVSTAILAGLRRTSAVFQAQLASAVTSLAIGLPLAAYGGVTLAVVGSGLAATAGVLTAVRSLRRAE